jgi:riboflavin synthase
MFNGIIFNTGIVKSIKKKSNSLLISVKSNIRFTKKDLGESVSCNGVCLTITNIKKDLIYFYISKETLKRSNFDKIKIEQKINLEKSLIFGQKISGHFIQGHVDATAIIQKIKFQSKTWIIRFKIKNNKFIVEKASISINGVSLTISKVINNFFEINVIPHTLQLTNLKDLKIHDVVNVELDIFSKYMYKYSI